MYRHVLEVWIDSCPFNPFVTGEFQHTLILNFPLQRKSKNDNSRNFTDQSTCMYVCTSNKQLIHAPQKKIGTKNL